MCPEELIFGLDLYSICFLVGILCAFIVARIYMDKLKVYYKVQNLVIIAGAISILVGYFSSIFFQAIYNAIESGVFEINEYTGMTFYGGAIGGALTFLLIYFLIGPKVTDGKSKEDLQPVIDMASCAILIAHAFGRLGCFFAGCCYGKETDSFLGVKFPFLDHKVLPTQIFESSFLFILFFVMSYLLLKRKQKGTLYLYMICYGIWRFFIEFFRGDERGKTIISFLSPSQFIAILMIIAGVILYIILLRKLKENPKKCCIIDEETKK